MNIKTFLDFITEKSLSDLDIWPPANTEAIMQSLLPPSVLGNFIPIAQNGADCLLCLWHIRDKPIADPENLPVVWIDNEGFNSVVATNIQEVLSILPYGMGCIYDIVSYWNYYIESPTDYQTPTRRYTKKYLKAQLKEMSLTEDYPHLIAFNKSNNIKTTADPVSVIGDALKTLPKIQPWLDERRS